MRECAVPTFHGNCEIWAKKGGHAALCPPYRNLDGNPHRRTQPTHRAVAERDVAAMRAGDVAGNRPSKARAAFVLVARIVEPQERLEHLFAQARRNAGAIVIDSD